VPTTQSASPLETVEAKWTPCDTRNAGAFSAVAYYFARDLQKALNIPIGLIGSYVGGTAADKWISEKSLLSHPDLKSLVARQKQSELSYDPAKAKADFEAAKARYDSSAATGKKPAKLPTLAADPKGRGPASLYNGMIAPLQPFAFCG
jgi:sialate O-acetylesterase